MIIVDTSVWVAHLRGQTSCLDEILGDGSIRIHPFVLGELLLNGLPRKGAFSIDTFSEFSEAPVASIAEVAGFIQWAGLAGTGIGYVDAHLLVSARLAEGLILTLDTHLHAQAHRFRLAFEPHRTIR